MTRREASTAALGSAVSYSSFGIRIAKYRTVCFTGVLIASLAFAQRKKSGADQGDIQALADVEQRLFTELRRLEKMDAEATKISTSAGKIREEVRKATAALDRMVTHAKSTLRALNIELHDEEAECADPILATRIAPPRKCRLMTRMRKRQSERVRVTVTW